MIGEFKQHKLSSTSGKCLFDWHTVTTAVLQSLISKWQYSKCKSEFKSLVSQQLFGT
jgi:hypothetical protein